MFSELKYFYAKNSSLEYKRLFQGHLVYFTSSDKVHVVFEEHVCFKYFVRISAKKEKRKEKSCSEES